MGRREYEARDLASACRRMARALVRRADTGDEQALCELLALRTQLDEQIVEAGARLHAHYSWTEIAGAVNLSGAGQMSRQAARQRFGARADELATMEEKTA